MSENPRREPLLHVTGGRRALPEVHLGRKRIFVRPLLVGLHAFKEVMYIMSYDHHSITFMILIFIHQHLH